MKGPFPDCLLIYKFCGLGDSLQCSQGPSLNLMFKQHQQFEIDAETLCLNGNLASNFTRRVLQIYLSEL